MRFLSISFRHFGPFAEQTLDVSAGSFGLHLIYGPNEAGKSSALRGVRCFLFGFPGQAPDNFIYKYSQFRIHARLANGRSEVLESLRRKGHKDTLRAVDDKTAIPEDRLHAFIGGLREEQFELLFGLDLDLLKQGGHLIAGGESNLGEALFAAGAGLAGLREIARELDQRKGELYKAKGTTHVLASLQALQAEKEKEREWALAAEIYAAKEDEFRAAQAAAEWSRKERSEARAKLGQLERYRSALPTISQLNTARGRLREVQAARRLSVRFEEEHRDTSAKMIGAQTSVTKLRSDVEVLETEIKQLALPSELLAEERVIDELREQVAVWSRQKVEAIKADTRRREMEAKARDISVDLIGSTDLERAKKYRLRTEETDRIRALARELQGIKVEVINSQVQFGDHSKKIAEGERKLAEMGETDDHSAARALVDEIVAEGPLEAQLRQQTQACDREETGIRNTLARLTPSCPEPLDRLAALPLPSEQAIKQHGQEFVKRADELERSRESLRQAREGLIALEKRIATFQHGETVPSESELVTARRDRAVGLNTIRQRLAGERSPVEESGFIARHAPGRQLVDALEVSVELCDYLADRLRHEAGRVAQWHTLQGEHYEQTERIALLKTDVQHKQELFDRAETTWRSIWAHAGIPSEAPSVMQDWVNQFVQLRERTEKWLDSKQQCTLLTSRIEILRRQIDDALPGSSAADSLRRALDLARQHLKNMDDARQNRQNLIDESDRLRREAAQAESKHRTAEDRQKQWQTEWAEAVNPLQLGSKVDITTVDTYLGRIDDMQEHLKDARIKMAQIRDIEADRDALLQRLTSLSIRIDPTNPLSTVESIEADYRKVDRSLSEARIKRTRSEHLHTQLARKRDELQTAERGRQAAEAKLAVMVTEAGVADVTQLPLAIERSRLRSQAEQQLRGHEDALAQQAQGEPADQFEAAALARREGIDQAIETLREGFDRFDGEVLKAEIAANNADEQLKKWQEASADAAMARQEAAFLARQLQDQVTEYVTLHLARRALDRAVERYRSRHQDSMLARAGTYFQNLTDGDFVGLDIDNEDGTTVLRALRSDRSRVDASVPVDGLSDGTRDQLFLALRLAGIEQHLSDREPMPLIIDDVLVNFDDRRASATLRSLADLSARTQILLFTHHRHIVELARKSIPTVLVCHELQQAK